VWVGLSDSAAHLVLRDFSALHLEQRVHGRLSVSQNTAQFTAPPFTGTRNCAKRNGFAGQFCTSIDLQSNRARAFLLSSSQPYQTKVRLFSICLAL
jgi:hypothetical protein